MDGGATLLLGRIFPFLLIILYTFLRYVGPLGSVAEKSDRIFGDYTKSIFQDDDWQQYVDSDASDDALDSIIETSDTTDLGDLLGAITFKTNDIKYLFQTHTKVAHRLLQIPIDIAVTAFAGIVIISAELLTNPAGATVTLVIAGYTCTIETDAIILFVLVTQSGFGLGLWLGTDSCLSDQSPFHYQTEEQSPNSPSPSDFFCILLRRSSWSFCEWLRYYANPWISIFYNGVVIVAILIVSYI
jgi:hypothetical protein